MADALTENVHNFLKLEHFEYKYQNGEFVMLTAYGQKKWKTVLFCADGMIICYSVFPWTVPPAEFQAAYRFINDWNSHQRVGCFFLFNGRIAFRYGVPVLDLFSSDIYIKDAFTSCSAVTYAYWERVFQISKVNNERR